MPKGGQMMSENIRLKRDLVLQSFAPLFLLLSMKYAHCYWKYVKPFVEMFKVEKVRVFSKIIHHSIFGDFIVFLVSVLWILWAILVYCGFTGIFRVGFDSRGEQIDILNDRLDSGATFLVTFVLPLLIDDINSFRGFAIFAVLLGLIIILVTRSDLFYQNPVLTLLGYKVFEFQFKTPYTDIEKQDKIYVGITKGKMVIEQVNIKRKYIADDVFIIFNE